MEENNNNNNNSNSSSSNRSNNSNNSSSWNRYMEEISSSRSRNDIDETPTNDNKKDVLGKRGRLEEPTVEEENKKPRELDDCPICLNSLDEIDTKNPIQQLNCGHKFHQNCIYDWMNSINQENTHQCPICRTDISQDQQSLDRASAPAPPAPPPASTMPLHERRLQQVINYETGIGLHENRPVPFLGAVVCYGNTVYKTYLNTEFNLTTNSTLGELKGAVLSKQNDIISSLPSDFVCTARNIASQLTRGYITPRDRHIEITNVHFTTPSECFIKGFSEINLNNDDLTLGAIYRKYQEDLLKFYGDSHYIRSVFNNYTIERSRPDSYEPEYIRTDYFLDPNGPVIPERFRPIEAYPSQTQASRNLIAWLCFKIDCVRRGGKTRKNKKRKKTKKKKSRIMKKKTYKRQKY